MKKIYYITMDQAFEVVKRWEINKQVNRHLFLAMEDNKICAIDNTDGECYTEDFQTLEEAVKWLLDIN